MVDETGLTGRSDFTDDLSSYSANAEPGEQLAMTGIVMFPGALQLTECRHRGAASGLEHSFSGRRTLDLATELRESGEYMELLQGTRRYSGPMCQTAGWCA